MAVKSSNGLGAPNSAEYFFASLGPILARHPGFVCPIVGNSQSNYPPEGNQRDRQVSICQCQHLCRWKDLQSFLTNSAVA